MIESWGEVDVLENFKPYSVTSGMLTVTFSNYGVSFSRAAVVRLEKPEYATLLINNEEKISKKRKNGKY